MEKLSAALNMITESQQTVKSEYHITTKQTIEIKWIWYNICVCGWKRSLCAYLLDAQCDEFGAAVCDSAAGLQETRSHHRLQTGLDCEDHAALVHAAETTTVNVTTTFYTPMS